MEQQRVRIGVTGGIGSGKSYVCRILESRGYPVYDCDREARRLMVSNEEIRNDLVALLGKEAYLSQDDAYVLNKPLITRYLFSSEEHALRINAIVHPRVKSDFVRWASEQTSDMVFVESAILQQARFLDVLDEVLLISAPEPVCLSRAMTRDVATAHQIRQRMEQQQSLDVMRQFAQYEIVNDGETDLSSSIDAFITSIQNKYQLC